jgi:putative two-component system response regulator
MTSPAFLRAAPMRVVIVDDTPLNLTLMQALIGKVEGCTAQAFDNPLRALESCIREEPDLLIVDYMMPELDGLEFIRRLRAVEGRQDVPILMVTADHEKQTRYDALQCGATDFLNKPIDRHEFQPRVRNMLALRRAHLASRERAETLAAEVRRATADLHARERETITRLARAAEFRDPETGAHIQRMAHYSALIARRLGLPGEQAEAILQAAPMHDVGKMGIPDHILLKPGRLTPEEFEVMKRHPLIGHDILKGSASAIVQLGSSIALTHHEKFDGSGYPQGLTGPAIPLEGRIVAIADVFDALTSERPYKKAWPLTDARGFLLEGRGRHFDPAGVDAFLAGWDEAMAIRERFGVE